MRKGILVSAMLLCGITTSRAQFTVIDPAHIATSIVNATKELVQTSSTATNMLRNFQEVQKLYNQNKAYYDRLKGVHSLVRSARKVNQTILLTGEISEIYVRSFGRMVADPHFRTEELSAIASGYTLLLQESSDLLLSLNDVISVNGLSMTDAERLAHIERVYEQMVHQRDLVNYYTRKNISVAYLRAKKEGDTGSVASLYGKADEKYW